MATKSKRQFVPSAFNFWLLFVVWLLLNNSYSLGNIILAAVVSWLILFLVSGLQTAEAKVKKPWLAGRYVAVMLYDIFVSNVIVAKQVLGPTHHLRPGFIAVPLDITQSLPITLLASTISLTPGTVSTELSKDRKTLYIHALHVENEAELIAEIKKRYEAPLMEIFGC